jgi:carbamoylphosphate synthase small subunit
MNKEKAILALADGTVFEGISIGAPGLCSVCKR